MQKKVNKGIKKYIFNPLFGEVVYLTILSFFLLFYSLYTIQYLGQWPQINFSYIRTSLFVFVFFKCLFMNKEEIEVKEIVIIFMVLSFLYISFQNTGYVELFDAALLIVGAKGVKFQSIIKTYLTVKVIFIISVVLGSRIGLFENLIYNQHGRIRESFGFIYPTDFAAQVFFVVAAWAILRKMKLTVIDLFGMVLLAIFLKWKCDARTSVACILCIVVGVFFLKIIKRIEKQSVLKKIFLSLPYIFSGVMILICRFYNPNNQILAWINRVTSQRLRFGKKTFDNYDIKLFGQYIEMIGNGGTTEKPIDYTFIDCSYINILMRFGLAVFVVIMILITFTMLKFYQSILVIGVIVIICLHSVMEHHLFDMHYNFMLLLPLCEYSCDIIDKSN